MPTRSMRVDERYSSAFIITRALPARCVRDAPLCCALLNAADMRARNASDAMRAFARAEWRLCHTLAPPAHAVAYHYADAGDGRQVA